ncbi:MAG TPA: MoaD/ThiS family protein [Xanthomonadaceae bacterium]|nr:MoaD/ThiS family protein [Xanthomonadaceae bacterium]
MGAQATVLYFAALRDTAGVASERVDAHGSLGDVYDALRERHGFQWSRSQLRVAVDGAFVRWDETVRAGTEIAFIPPVSGG